MIEQARKYSTNIPKVVAVATGILTLFTAAYGLYLSFQSLVRAIRGEFPEITQQLMYFYPALYSMLSVTIVCCLVLAWCGLGQVRLRLTHLKLFIWLFVFEILYFTFIGGFLWLMPNIGTSVGAATGVANQGLIPPFFILLPLWAPFALAWARKQLTRTTTRHLVQPLPTGVAGYRETSLGGMVKTKLLRALLGGVGGGASFFLLLSVAKSFDALNKHISDFIFHLVAFFFGGLCVIYSAMLDSPISPRIPGWRYMTILLVVLASFFGAAFQFQIPFSLFSFLPMGLIIGIVLNGFSLRAFRNSLWAFTGSVFGIVSLAFGLWFFAAVSGTVISATYVKDLLDNPGVLFIRHGVTWYGFTLGLLLSQLPLQKARETDNSQ